MVQFHEKPHLIIIILFYLKFSILWNLEIIQVGDIDKESEMSLFRCEIVFIAMGNRVPIFLMNRRHARTDADYALIFWTRIATDKRRVNKAN